jgi:hypothetical protein
VSATKYVCTQRFFGVQRLDFLISGTIMVALLLHAFMDQLVLASSSRARARLH